MNKTVFANNPLNRTANLRNNIEWINSIKRDSNTKYLIFYNEKPLINPSIDHSKNSEIKLNQLFIECEINNIQQTLLFLKTNKKCNFKQLIDITAVDFPEREKRFKVIYLLLSHENNNRVIITSNLSLIHI